jgi:mercuric ion transport protein
MQTDRALLATGTVGAIFAAICCATPLLTILLGALGLTAWLARADYVLIPALLICLGLIGAGLYLRRNAAQACCDPTAPNKVSNHE